MIKPLDISNFTIDKTGWQKVKFGDVVYEPKESVKDPRSEHVEHVVGLEHINSEDIHLRRSASIEEETTFTKKFSKGDVLFGRRRAYLKKAARAEFEGICSGDITVLRASDRLLPELLPFIVNNDNFFDYAITHSAGGLSPRVKFKDLAIYEFLLPPKSIQLEIIDLLEAQDKYFENIKNSLKRISIYYDSILNDFASELKSGWFHKSLKDVSKINKQTLSSKTPTDYQFRYLDLTSITAPKVIGEMKKVKYADAPSRARRVVENQSSIIALVRPYQKKIVFIEDADDVISSTGTAVVEANEDINSRFLFHQFFSNRFLKFCERMMTGTTYPAITSDDLGLFKVALPSSIVEQEKLAKLLDEIETNLSAFQKIQDKTFNLKKSIINQVF